MWVNGFCIRSSGWPRARAVGCCSVANVVNVVRGPVELDDAEAVSLGSGAQAGCRARRSRIGRADRRIDFRHIRCGRCDQVRLRKQARPRLFLYDRLSSPGHRGAGASQLKTQSECVQYHFKLDTTCECEQCRVGSKRSDERILQSTKNVPVERLLDPAQEQVDVIGRENGNQRVHDVCCRKQSSVKIRGGTRDPVGEVCDGPLDVPDDAVGRQARRQRGRQRGQGTPPPPVAVSDASEWETLDTDAAVSAWISLTKAAVP